MLERLLTESEKAKLQSMEPFLTSVEQREWVKMLNSFDKLLTIFFLH